jgi:hypothetical protein
MRASLIFAAYAICALESCSALDRVQPQAAPLQIEMDAFSGRPNPRWELTAAQAAEFIRRLRALQSPGGNAAAHEGLGYRGFIVTANGGKVDGYDEVRLYRGTILKRHGDRAEAFRDPSRGLERWLLDSARGHVAESIRQYVRGEIER